MTNDKDVAGCVRLINANVWWEVGIAMGFRKDAIIFIDQEDEIPSDFYNNISIHKFKEKEDVESVLKDLFQNPLTTKPPALEWCPKT